jgi:hypothetical protein
MAGLLRGAVARWICWFGPCCFVRGGVRGRIVLAGQFDGVNAIDGQFVAVAISRQKDFDKGGLLQLWMGELTVIYIAYYALASLQPDRDIAPIIEGGFDLSFEII